jgi:hypothetical protein
MTVWGTGDRRKSILLVAPLIAPLIAIGLAGCGAPGQSETPSNASPITALHDAITALEKEPNYTLTFTDSPGTPGGGTAVYRVTIEEPDRIAISGGLNVIAIGSTGYSKSPSGWTTFHHVEVSANYMNDMLADINIVKRATSVNRSGDIYSVPALEAATLLKTTGLPRFQAAADVTFSARVDNGLIRSVSLRVKTPSLIADSIVVRDIGDSPAVTAPRSRSA